MGWNTELQPISLCATRFTKFKSKQPGARDRQIEMSIMLKSLRWEHHSGCCLLVYYIIILIYYVEAPFQKVSWSTNLVWQCNEETS